MKHTPGPWSVHSIVGSIHGPDGLPIFTSGCEGSEEGQANARLIAAAPQMYEELKNLHAEGDCGHETPGVHGCFCDILTKIDGTNV